MFLLDLSLATLPFCLTTLFRQAKIFNANLIRTLFLGNTFLNPLLHYDILLIEERIRAGINFQQQWYILNASLQGSAKVMGRKSSAAPEAV